MRVMHIPSPRIKSGADSNLSPLKEERKVAWAAEKPRRGVI
jgi:hypothetical protein